MKNRSLLSIIEKFGIVFAIHTYQEFENFFGIGLEDINAIDMNLIRVVVVIYGNTECIANDV